MATAMDNLESAVHMYQVDHSPEVLGDILTQLDGLVLSVVHHMLRVYRGTINLEFDDLYQVGMIGVIRALGTLPDQFDLDQIRMRVVAYVKAEIIKQFRAEKRNYAFKHCIMCGEESISDAPMYLRVEVRELFNLLIQDGVITREDFYFLYHRFVNEIPVRVLADRYGKTLHGIIMWERRILRVLRQDMRVRGFVTTK